MHSSPHANNKHHFQNLPAWRQPVAGSRCRETLKRSGACQFAALIRSWTVSVDYQDCRTDPGGIRNQSERLTAPRSVRSSCPCRRRDGGATTADTARGYLPGLTARPPTDPAGRGTRAGPRIGRASGGIEAKGGTVISIHRRI